MDEADLKQRIDDLQAALINQADLRQRIDEIEADLEVVILCSHPDILEQVRGRVASADAQSHWANPSPVDPALLEKYRAFLKRHDRAGD